MRIANHRLEGAPFTPAQWTGGEIAPRVVILHDTASRLDPGSAATYLARNQAKVSVHFVVERDGTVRQLVPTNLQANHAGQSSFQGRAGCNAFSLGVEIVNPGRMTRAAGGRARAWWGDSFDIAEHDIEEVTTPEHGPGLWMPYTEAQIDALLGLLVVLFRDVGSLQDITTHWYVSPGRKVDTNPLFPLEHLRALVLGRDDPAEAAAEEGSDAAQGIWARVATHGSALNLRRWPSYNPNVIGQVPNGAVVPVIRFGSFGGELWNLVRWDGREGWVVDRYTAQVEPEPARPTARAR